MNASTDPFSGFSQRLIFGIVAPLISATVAILIATGVAKPYPNLMIAYLICVAIGVFGLIQFIIAIAELRQS